MISTESGWRCLACGSADLCYGNYGQHGWFYAYGGSRLFGGKRVLAVACMGCGVVWPYLGERDKLRLAEDQARRRAQRGW